MPKRWTGTPLLVIISSPSGGGKSTVIRRLRTRHPEFLYSVSVTTRPRRRRERAGVHYRFVSEAAFAAMRQGRRLVEWASVHDCFYGTPTANIRRAKRLKRVMLFDLDVQGAARLKDSVAHVVTLFLRPPSWAVLRRRLVGRGSDSAARVRRRLQTARAELRRTKEYDYVVTNNRLDSCVSDCESIIRAELLRQSPR
ncbi:MAG TPA: guanylate kinase [candidate division Zixibacteria bacterium]|jgi:guanylate kinase